MDVKLKIVKIRTRNDEVIFRAKILQGWWIFKIWRWMPGEFRNSLGTFPDKKSAIEAAIRYLKTGEEETYDVIVQIN